MEIGDGKIPFLDCLVTRDNNRLRTTIDRKPTHTDRLLNQSSYNPTSHKATTGRHLIPSTKLTSSSHKTFHLSYMKFLDEMFIKVKVSSIFKGKKTI